MKLEAMIVEDSFSSYDFSFELKCSALADELSDEIDSGNSIPNMQRKSSKRFFEKDGEEFLIDFFGDEYESVQQSTKE